MTERIHETSRTGYERFRNMSKNTNEEKTHEDYMNQVKEHAQEMYTKLKNGETEPTYQIGANSFSIKEWTKFIKNFDHAQEQIRLSIEKDIEERDKKTKEKQRHDALTKASKNSESVYSKEDEMYLAQPLVSDFIQCSNKSDEDEQEKHYIVWYTKDAIYCREVGQQGILWCIKLINQDQYDQINDFVKTIDSEGNNPFVTKEEFWKSLLLDKQSEIK